MSHQYTNHQEYCATCEYWGGARSFFDRYCKRIEVESSTAKGRCLNRDSGWFTKSDGTQACFRCPKYEMWRLMKQ